MARIIISAADLPTARAMAGHILAIIAMHGQWTDQALMKRGYSLDQINRLSAAALAIAQRHPVSLDSEANAVRQLPLPKD